MRLKANFGGIPLEVWFKPSFKVITTDNFIETLLTENTLEVYDPWESRMRKARGNRSLRDAYLVLSEYGTTIDGLEVTFEEAPELPSTNEVGVTY